MASDKRRIEDLIERLSNSGIDQARELADLWQQQRDDWMQAICAMTDIYLPRDEKIMLPSGKVVTVQWPGHPSAQEIEFVALYISIKLKYAQEGDPRTKSIAEITDAATDPDTLPVRPR